MGSAAAETQRRRALAAFEQFLSTPLDAVLTRHTTTHPEQAAVALFHSVVADVPAYGRFLNAQGVDPSAISTFRDFERLPMVTKQNYLQQYLLADLCRGGRLEDCDMVAVSSGSTGQPTFWPRSFSDELQIARRFEQVFVDSFEADVRRTLAVVCFALGTWVGGIYSAHCCRVLASKGYPITVVTPGNNKEEIFRVVRELGPTFEQVVLLGYPPFLKDVVDSGRVRGVDWRRYHIKMVLAGEVFSEEWRTLVGERVGSADPCYGSAALYGTADAGVLGNETPLSIAIRRFLADRPEAARRLFGESRLPTLVQYDPLSRFFEAHGGQLLFTGDNGVPLVRYNILDTGGIITYEAMMKFLAASEFNPVETMSRLGRREARRLPFVYVFGRSDFTVSYFGANIYPENVTVGLEQAAVKEWVTGKFVLEVQEGDDRNKYLAVTVEMALGVEATDDRRGAIAASIQAQLERLSSEFAHYVPAAYQAPRVTLASMGDPEFFPAGVKHRYTRR